MTTEYNGELVVGLDSSNDQLVQELSHQVAEIDLALMDLEDNPDADLQAVLEAEREDIVGQIADARSDGR